MKINYNVQGETRKKLVGIISEAINEPLSYAGAPTFAYCIGAFTITREGILEFDSAKTDLEKVKAVMDALSAAGFQYDGSDCLAIGYPLEGFTEEGIGNLRKLVASKEPLIKKALGVEELPIERGETELTFDWFRTGLTREETYAFAQFITCLCLTAKEKKRVTAKAPESFENEKFAMRVWLIGLGMVGKEYALARKLLLKNLDGNSSWRYGAPEKADSIEADSTTPEEIPAEEPTPAQAVDAEVGVDD